MADPARDFARFLMFVEVRTLAECWPWTGSRPGGLYGHFSVAGEAVKAHRRMYELAVGPIPEGLLIRHKCDNPSCVNPMHLEPGTATDNMQDKVQRGRYADRQGTKHPLAKLDDDKVREIRRRASLGETHHSLAAAYGVRRGQIGKIVQRINWRHI